MPQLNLDPTAKQVAEGEAYLAGNEYPGRVIITGRNSVGDLAIQAYALTGRSEGSRNRIFIPESANFNENYVVGVRTVAPDMTPEEMSKVENSALIYYKAMDEIDGAYVVSNGAQTESVLDSILSRNSALNPRILHLEEAVRDAPVVDGVDLSIYEPDGPNFTPRITGAIHALDGASPFGLSIVRKDNRSRPRYFTYKGRDVKELTAGVGYGIQTYKGNDDPLPSFDREPYAFPLGESVEEIAHSLWGVLNQDNRVAVVVRSIDDFGGTEYHIVNARGSETHIPVY